MKKWQVGIYTRLSNDDKVDDESNSIKTQKEMIYLYISRNKDLKIYKEYTDDGHTGTDFNRPGYQEMMNDIETKKINAIIVKDLSRLGRNYIGVGDFIETIIPKYNLRFISINDNIDTKNYSIENNELDISFKNLLNESYVRDTSNKIRSSLKAAKHIGDFIGKSTPYGYLKDPEDNHKFIIDDEAATVVKKIFELALRGLSKHQISNWLQEKNIYTPSMYFKYKYNIDIPYVAEKWDSNVLDNILKNETYIGSLIQGKRSRISHKKHNIVRTPEDEWIIYKNHHKAIINEDVFNQVQSLLYERNTRSNVDGIIPKYSGILKCSECKKNLRRFKRIKNNKEQFYYYCSSYIKDKSCNKHFINEKELDDLVIKAINHELKLYKDLPQKIKDILSNPRNSYNMENTKMKILSINEKIDELKKIIDDLMEDYKNNIITKKDYEIFSHEYLYNLNQLIIEKEQLEGNKNEVENCKWIKRLSKMEYLDYTDRTIINNLINVIYVDDNKNIEIKFKFKDDLEDIIELSKK